LNNNSRVDELSWTAREGNKKATLKLI
jgi:hypothetical protein